MKKSSLLMITIFALYLGSCKKEDKTEPTGSTTTPTPTLGDKFIEIHSADTMYVVAADPLDTKKVDPPSFKAYKKNGEVMDNSQVSIWCANSLNFDQNRKNSTPIGEFYIAEITTKNTWANANQFFVYDVPWGGTDIKRDTIYVKLIADTEPPIWEKTMTIPAPRTSFSGWPNGYSLYPNDVLSFTVKGYKNGVTTIKFEPHYIFSTDVTKPMVFCSSGTPETGYSQHIGGISDIQKQRFTYGRREQTLLVNLSFNKAVGSGNITSMKGEVRLDITDDTDQSIATPSFSTETFKIDF